jgi:phenylpropionate dioxygenase-like ring-hydroxylating dioxygenase large terminal subunit
MAWQRVASLSEIAVDGVLSVEVDGSSVALYRLANEVFATAGICTHAMAVLSDGFVEDGKIECPLHQGQFDIRSGKALCAPATEDLRTYAVKLEGDDVFIDMERAAAFTQAISNPMPDRQAGRNIPLSNTPTISAINSDTELSLRERYVWPTEGHTRIPDWVYTDQMIYEREVEKIFHGRTWNYVALECEVPNSGDFIRSNVGPTPVVVARAADGSINVFENRCSHRAAEFCRELSGNVKEFVCPYHQWSYDLHGNLAGVPFRRGVNGKGGMPADFNAAQHGLRRLNITAHRGVVFASYAQDMESLQDYLGPEVFKEFEATFDGRKPKLLGYYRHTLPGNWKLYHENLKDPYHATLLHTFLVTFGLLVAGNRSLMLADATGRHGVMASAKSERKSISSDAKKEMRAYRDGMTLAEPRFMDFIEEFDSPWSVTMATIWPNLIIQREMNTLGVRQIVPTGPHEFIMKWTMFGFEGDDDEMTRHRLRQGNLMGPAGFLGLEDNEAIKFVQDGMRHVPGGQHLVKLDPAVAAGTSDSLISEASIRAMYRHWRAEMGL